MDFVSPTVNYSKENKWQIRRFRHLQQYGIKPELVKEELCCSSTGYLGDLTDHTEISPTSSTGLPNNSFQKPLSVNIVDRESRLSSNRKESAIKIVYNALCSLIKSIPLRRSSYDSDRRRNSSSYTSVRSPKYLQIVPNSFPDTIQSHINSEVVKESLPNRVFPISQQDSLSPVSFHNGTKSNSSIKCENSLEDELFFDLKPSCSKTCE
uniref:Uncharacterized protein n=1 Tax=Acrobeloides nanus TaxID=290746 RepID=A0A914BVS9_9BILA